ncbi:MAG: reprolysin-like metallopeptidase [Saprospiraceae bacterium]
MKKLSTLLLFSCLTISLFAQQYWSDVTVNDLPNSEQKQAVPSEFRALELQFADWQKMLTAAPASFSGEQGIEIDLPLPTGEFAKFYATAAQVLAPALAAKYPQIRAYRIVGVNDSSLSGYIDINSRQFHAVIRTTAGEVYIDPLSKNEERLYHAYFTHHLEANNQDTPKLTCGYNAFSQESPIQPTTENTEQLNGTTKSAGVIQLRSYRFAISATSAFSNRFGGTKESILEAFNTSVVRLNEIFEREVAVTFTLIPETEELIFLDAATEPWNNLNQGGDLLGQSQVIFNNIVSPTLYDVGHVYTGNCSDVGGVARLAQVCSENKMRGVTCFGGELEFDVVRILAHEVGHQFAATHTMNQCDGNEENVTPGSAYEPGSGSTIMSYSGVCGEQNVQFGPDDYFHSNSLQQMIEFTRNADGNTCPTFIDIGNNEPEITLDYATGFFIPIGTPFQLTGSATDPDGDELFYNWEQFNLGPQTDLGTQRVNSPAFRTYEPTMNPTRVFPRIQAVVGNFREDVELLPAYSRALVFRFIARDHNEMGGAAVWQDIAFNATETAGPFLVTTANEADMVWEVGQYQEVTWDVANTTNATVNCQNVNIKLSLDGGFTYPVTLIENTPNDGNEFITVPDEIGERVRIRVEAADNIFFDISNQNLEIIAPSAPGYALTLTPNSQDVCVPDVVEIEVSSTSLLDFAEAINLEITEGVPSDVTFSFANATIQPGESTMLTVDFSNSSADGEVILTLNAMAADTVTATRLITLNAINTDFSAVQPQMPEDGVTGIVGAPTFMWSGSEFANTYDFQIATNDDFNENSIVDQAADLEATEFTIAQPLDEMMTFFWRVRANNECGAGEWTAPFLLSSISAICSPLNSPNVPVSLPGSIAMATSSLTIPVSGEISDLQVPVIRGTYPGVNGLRFILRSPAGTEAVLFSRNCGLTNGFNVGFDDDAPNAISCPPTSGNVEQPIEPLSVFIGEDTQGEWTLTVDVQDPGFGGGGSLEEWSLEFCSIVSTTEIGDSDQIKVFPNPVKASLTLEMAQPLTSESVLTIYNAQGQLVSERKLANQQNIVTMSTAHLPTGIYVVTLLSDNQLFTKQFVKL